MVIRSRGSPVQWRILTSVWYSVYVCYVCVFMYDHVPISMLCVCLWICSCACMCLWIYVHMHAHVCMVHRSISSVFLNHSLPHFLRQGLSLNLELIHSVRPMPACLRGPRLHLASPGITSAHHHTWVLMWVLGWKLIPLRSQWALYWLSQLHPLVFTHATWLSCPSLWCTLPSSPGQSQPELVAGLLGTEGPACLSCLNFLRCQMVTQTVAAIPEGFGEDVTDDCWQSSEDRAWYGASSLSYPLESQH